MLTAAESEHELLEDPSPDQVRLLVRDVLEKARRHRTTVGESLASPSEIQVDEASDVIVELVAPRNPEIANLPRSS